MSTIDIYLLAILSCKNRLSLSTLVGKIQLINTRKSPSRITIYKRLHTLKGDKLVNTFWKEGKKIYEISPEGMLFIKEFKNQLTE
jgi:DNA-binding PadR family transcriptional regulator